MMRALERRLINPAIRALLDLGVAPRAYALLETTGRRTGLARHTPVGNGLRGDIFWLVTQHGERAAYVKNLIADPRVGVKIRRRWRSGRATVVPDDDGLARRRELDRANGLVGRLDGIVFRAGATNVTTVRIDLE
jgi:deazaflavin-dependent oxidoreductase (nitroreductase family)